MTENAEIQVETIQNALEWIDEQLASETSTFPSEVLNKTKEQLKSSLSVLRDEVDVPKQREVVRTLQLMTRDTIPIYRQPQFTEEINTPRMRDPIAYPTEPRYFTQQAQAERRGVEITLPEAIEEVTEDVRRRVQRRIRREPTTPTPPAEIREPSRGEDISQYLYSADSPQSKGRRIPDFEGDWLPNMIDLFTQHGLNHEEIPWDELNDDNIYYFGALRHHNGRDRKGLFVYCEDEAENRCHLHTIWSQGQSLAFGSNEPYHIEGNINEVLLKARDRIANWTGRGSGGGYALTKGSISAYKWLPLSSRSRTILNNGWRRNLIADTYGRDHPLYNTITVFRSAERPKMCKLRWEKEQKK